MKSLKELRNIDFKLTGTELFFSRVKNLTERKLDFDVFLPSLNMNLQREKVWNLTQKRELIMSVFLERYIPSVCLMSLIDGDGVSEADVIQVIDGKQRLTTFIDFLNDEFSINLEGMEFYFSELPEDYSRAIAYYEIKSQVAYEQFERRFTDKDKIDWFSRINFFGTPQDIEHLKKLKP